MMITCKEDLINTYIENDHGELRDLYLAKCERFGLMINSACYTTRSEVIFTKLPKGQFGNVDHSGPDIAYIVEHFGEMKKLTLSDLRPAKQYAVLHKGGSYSFQSDKPIGDDVVACFDLVHSEKPLSEDFFDENRQDDKQMKTYNTYQEAKIANPGGKVYESIGGKFAAESYVSHIALCGCNQGWNECNPSDHCMTVEEFLKAGYELVRGDKVLHRGLVNCIEGDPIANKPMPEIDRETYILRAAALEEKPRTKVEYVKCEFIKLSDAAKAVDAGDIQFSNFGNQPIDDKALALHYYNNGTLSFYRRIETETNWQDDIEEKYDAVKMPRGEGSDLYLGPCWDESAFVEFCVDVAKVNGFKLVN